MEELETLRTRVATLERETRFLRRGATLLVALIAVGVLILQQLLAAHVDAGTNPHQRRHPDEQPARLAPK